MRGERERAPFDARSRRWIGGLAALLAGPLLLMIGAGGCRSGPPLPDATQAGPTFSAELALAHLDRLERIGPRRPGAETDGAARDYLARALEQGGLEIVQEVGAAAGSSDDVGPPDPAALIARWDGPSPDALLLVAPYDVSGGTLGLDDGGLVVTLELARALVHSEVPYDVVVALAPVAAGPVAARASMPPRRAALVRAGERLVVGLEAAGVALARTRLAVVLAADMRTGSRMARDLLSPPVPRDLVWRTASRLGHSEVFAPWERWTSPVGLQTPLRAAGLRQVLALVPSEAPLAAPVPAPAAPAAAPAAASEPAGRGPAPAAERPAAGDLPAADAEAEAEGGPGRTVRAVGEVGYAGLMELVARLAQVDAFAP